MAHDFKDTILFKAGDVIFKEGDPPGSLYIIEVGVVEISRGQETDKVVLAERSTKEVFGEMALVDLQPRSATATALTDVYAHEVSEEVFTSYLSELNPLIFNVFRSLVTTIRDMNETQELIGHMLKLRARVG